MTFAFCQNGLIERRANVFAEEMRSMVPVHLVELVCRSGG